MSLPPSQTPIHFFTLVLNGQPFIRYHLEVFKQLKCTWHWHIIEGVAELKHDTSWSLAFGGAVNDLFHKNGRSIDGTSEYLDELQKECSGQVTVYRKPEGIFWEGKIEMVNAPLKNISEDCLLWQVDVDELWTVEQIEKCHQLFANYPKKMSASYFCHYFVGPNLITTTRNTYGNQSGEWLRTWRFSPGYRWTSHEPPRLCKPQAGNQWLDVASLDPFTRDQTEEEGLVFQHYAYVTEEQVKFKESYYGYANAVNQWRVLQTQYQFPLALKNYFPWVQDKTEVDTTPSQGIYPLAYPVEPHEPMPVAPLVSASLRRHSFGETSPKLQSAFVRNELQRDTRIHPGTEAHAPLRRRVGDSWGFDHQDPLKIKKILFIRTDAIGDNILAASMLAPICKKYSMAKVTVVCQEHIAELYTSSPFIDKVIPFHRNRAYKDPDYKKDVVRRIQLEKADLVLNSVYSREPLTDIFAIGSDAPHRVVFNSHHCNYMTTQNRDQCNKFYHRVLPGGVPHQSELQRHRDFLKGLGIHTGELKPTLWLTQEDEVFADQFFKERGLERGNVLALFAGSQWDQKVYEGYGVALLEFCKEQNIKILALGSKEDYSANQMHLDQMTDAINACGVTTLRQTAALLKRCRMGVGADSAIAHMAAALEIPHVIVLGGGHFGRFLPYSAQTSVVCLPLECYGCSWSCKFSTPYCVKQISPQVLLEAIQETYRNNASRPRIFIQGSDRWKPQAHQPVWQLFEEFISRDEAELIFVGQGKEKWNGVKSQEHWKQVSHALEMVQTLRLNQQNEKATRVLAQAIVRFPRAIHLQKLQAEHQAHVQNS